MLKLLDIVAYFTRLYWRKLFGHVSALVFALLVAGNGWAQVVVSTSSYNIADELCGNGLDDSQSGYTKGSCPAGWADAVFSDGCDLLCPEPDKDHDGYDSDVDCDDTNRRVFPGVQVSAGGGQYKTCQSDGTYTAAGALTTGTHTYYVDCTSGNNSNAGTSLATAFATIGKIAGGSTGSPPASPVTLVAGDHVYITGNCSTTYSDGTLQVHAYLTQAGSAGNEIIIEGLPGALPTITQSSGFGFSVASTASYVTFKNLIGTNTSTTRGTFVYGGGDHVTVSNIVAHSITGDGNNNDSCVRASGTNYFRVDHSLLWDCKENGAGNEQNIDGIKWMDDDGVGDGMGHYAGYNVVGDDAKDSTNGGHCFRSKHGTNAADSAPDGTIIERNYCINPGTFGVQWDGSGLKLRRNLFYGTGSDKLLYVIDASDSGINDQDANEVTDNTFYKMSALNWNSVNTSAVMSYTVTGNVFYDGDTSYVAGNNEGIFSICGYCSDATKATLEALHYFESHGNCFYNPNTALVFSYFAVSSGPSDDEGANYSFSSWKALTVQTPTFDSDSYSENPTVDSYFRATSTNCANKGWLQTSEESTPGPTPTPTPTYTIPAAFSFSRRLR